MHTAAQTAVSFSCSAFKCGSGDVRGVHARQPTHTEGRRNAGFASARWVARLRVALVRLQRGDVDAKDALQHLRSRSRT